MPAKPILDLGYGTGNPAGRPDFRPVNPWGRPMPKVPEEPRRHALYQVHVKDKRRGSPTCGRTIAIGPKMAKEFAEMFSLTIANQIALGAERDWESPHLVMMI